MVKGEEGEGEGGGLKQTTVDKRHAKFQKCHLKLDAVSTFSLVQCYNTFSFVLRTIVDYSNVARISNVAFVSLKRARVGGRRFRPIVAVVSGASFSAQFGTYEIRNFGLLIQLSV